MILVILQSDVALINSLIVFFFCLWIDFDLGNLLDFLVSSMWIDFT